MLGINDNFFTLGGNSLKAVRVAAVLGTDYEVALNDLFERQTVAGLVQKVVYTKGLLQRRLDALKQATAKGETAGEEDAEYQQKLAEYLAGINRYQDINLTLRTGYHNVLRIYHICNGDRLSFGELAGFLSQAGIKVELASVNCFLDILAERANEDQFRETGRSGRTPGRGCQVTN